MAIGDFNGDGKADLAVTNQGSSTLSILLNNGDGTFAGATSIATINSPTNLIVGDFDGDAKADLVVSGYYNVSVLLGNGDRKFHSTPATSHCYGGVPISGDFNGDGKTDFIIGGAIYLGVGDGTFQSGNNMGIYGPAVVGDINADGKLDVVGLSYVALGKGDGAF